MSYKPVIHQFCLNVFIFKEKISLELLDYRPQINYIRLIWPVFILHMLLLLIQISWILCVFYLVRCKMGFSGLYVLA
jgi:hypothetical protein